MTILVLGASRGLGLEFVRQYRAEGERVIATARDSEGSARLQELGAEALKADVTDPASVSGLGWQLDGEKLDLALYVAGAMSRGRATEPPSRADFDRVMHTNVFGAMQVIPQVAPLVEAAGGRFVFLSSEMGRIGGTNNSYSWVYRASKAALNMAMVAAQPDYPQAIFVALHPGWVRTDMGGPEATFTPEQSVAGMRRTIAALGPGDRASFHAHDGRRMDTW